MSDPVANEFVSRAVVLDGWDLSIAAGLVLLAGVVSLLLRLGLEKRLSIAAVRAVVQLMLLGLILRYVFEPRAHWLLAIVVSVMLLVASREAVRRSEHRLHGLTLLSLLSLTLSAMFTTVVVTGIIIGVWPWYEPRYMIPLLGMILGNGLTGVSLCVDHLLTTLREKRGYIEMDLAMGATRWEAARGPLREAVRRGMIPIINTMSVVGIVSIPGMMTGQILAGADPSQAAKYQIVVMFMIAASTSLCCILMALLIYRSLFNVRHQLRAERITKTG
ncbi:MAG: iron export ABC transporter permease subunit FetB [Phycisphaerales bacterium]